MKYLLLLLCTAFSIGIAAQPNPKEQWENLFNGKDLKGWKQLNGKAPYEVKGGMIIGTTVPNEPNSFWLLKKTMLTLYWNWNLK